MDDFNNNGRTLDMYACASQDVAYSFAGSFIADRVEPRSAQGTCRCETLKTVNHRCVRLAGPAAEEWYLGSAALCQHSKFKTVASLFRDCHEACGLSGLDAIDVRFTAAHDWYPSTKARLYLALCFCRTTTCCTDWFLGGNHFWAAEIHVDSIWIVAW